MELETNEGLLMGQHVYIELGNDDDEGSDQLWLPDYYVVEDEEDPFVYAADDQGRIEKRRVVLGERNEDLGMVAIAEGLSYLDRIAFPDETVQVGMTVSETAYVPGNDQGMSGFGVMDHDDWEPETAPVEDMGRPAEDESPQMPPAGGPRG